MDLGTDAFDALNKAGYHATKSPEVLDDWLKSSATVLNMYEVKTDGSNPLGKEPNGNMRRLFQSVNRHPWRDLVEKFISLKQTNGIKPNTLSQLALIINDLYKLFGLDFEAFLKALVDKTPFTFANMKGTVTPNYTFIKPRALNDKFLESFIADLGDKVNVDDIYYMTNLYTLVTAINDYKGDVRDLHNIYEKHILKGGRKSTQRRKSKRHNKHGRKRRSSHKRSHKRR